MVFSFPPLGHPNNPHADTRLSLFLTLFVFFLFVLLFVFGERVSLTLATVPLGQSWECLIATIPVEVNVAHGLAVAVVVGPLSVGHSRIRSK